MLILKKKCLLHNIVKYIFALDVCTDPELLCGCWYELNRNCNCWWFWKGLGGVDSEKYGLSSTVSVHLEL